MPVTFFYYVQVVSTLSVLLPLCAGVWQFKRLAQAYRLFLLFLVIGFATDLAGWYFYLTQNVGANEYARHGYDLFEGVFLAWLIKRLSSNGIIIKSFSWLIPAIVLLWTGRFVYAELSSVFKSGTQIIYSFAAGFTLLHMTERAENLSRSLPFWIMLGIFFYCFCTYFIMAFLQTQLSGIWPIHNIINVSTNLIYLIGFLRSMSKNQQTASASF